MTLPCWQMLQVHKRQVFKRAQIITNDFSDRAANGPQPVNIAIFRAQATLSSHIMLSIFSMYISLAVLNILAFRLGFRFIYHW